MPPSEGEIFNEEVAYSLNKQFLLLELQITWQKQLFHAPMFEPESKRVVMQMR